MKRGLYYLFIVICLGVLVGVMYLYIAFPKVDQPSEVTIEGTDQQVTRGKYLAEHVAVCIDCHSARDWSKFSAPIKVGSYGKGGEAFDEAMGLPGTFYAKNITPHNLQNWTDGEIYRVITTGVTKSGAALFPIMPYPAYSKMDPEDVKAIIAYLRTLKPIENDTPDSEANFPMNIILRTIPQRAAPMQRPERRDSLAYGEYLTIIAGCAECHTPQRQGQDIEGMYLAGGFEFQMPFGTIRSSNITPHKQTGIGRWTKNQFINRFKQYNVPADSLPGIAEGDFNTIMPWKMYAGMTEEDLEAIYNYLQTVKPVENSVYKFTRASELASE